MESVHIDIEIPMVGFTDGKKGVAMSNSPFDGGVTHNQRMLFGDPLEGITDATGYRGPVACQAAGITYRQLDYWARTGLVSPSVRVAHGSGSQRLYSFRDILVLKVIKRLLDAGVSLQQVRKAVAVLSDRGIEDLASITLMSDGASVYECTSSEEIVDLLEGGQGVFGIAVGRVWREVECTLAELPKQDKDVISLEQLAAYRRRRNAS